MEALRWRGDALELLDQTRLPGEVVWNRYEDYRPVAADIRRLAVRGAPLIGVAAAYAYALAGLEFHGREEFSARMDEAKTALWNSRPTAVNLFWALERMEKKRLRVGDDPAALCAEAEGIEEENVAMNAAIGHLGAAVVPQEAGILTHCNAGALATGGIGTALGVIRAAHAQGKVKMVYADETRPLLQGSRLTAYELSADRIPVTVIADSMAAPLMGLGKIDLAVVGCDRMAANGDFANKIGTYSVAVNCRYHGVPFYVALPTSSMDLSLPDGRGIPIEYREGEELRALGGSRTAPDGAEVWNPAFDVTPHELVTGIITERGILYPPFREGIRALFPG